MLSFMLFGGLFSGIAVGGPPAAEAATVGRTTTIRYQSAVDYDFTLGATVQCKGVHQYGPRWPGTATSGGRDIYRCRSLSGPFTNVQHASGFVYETGEWSSDYFFDYHNVVVVNTRPVNLRIAGNNLSYHAIAYFAQR